MTPYRTSSYPETYYILRNLAYTGKTYLFTRYKVKARRHLKQSRRNKYTHVVMKPREEWVELDGATPASISEELFNQVQLKLKRNKELASRNTKREYLLTGYVFCEHCGRRYTAHTKGINSYYSCPKCKRRNLNTKYLEPAIWTQIEDVLSKPEVVMAGIELMRGDATNEECYRKELENIEIKLCHMAKEKDRVWKAFEITGDEAKFTREIKEIMLTMGESERQIVELRNKIELIGQAETNIQSIKEYCELVDQNLGNLSFLEKRKALESLRIKVIAGKEEVKLEGIIPIVSGQCA